jgi:hypothetical protein
MLCALRSDRRPDLRHLAFADLRTQHVILFVQPD